MSKEIEEDISDLMSIRDRRRLGVKVGKVLKFKDGDKVTVIRVTRIEGAKMYGVHTELVNQTVTRTHYGHDVINKVEGAIPFCRDCKVPINEPSTEDGDKKALDRADRTLSDGTEIPA